MANVILVHGLFADGSSYSDVIRILMAAGHTVTAVQLGRAGLHADAATVRGVLDVQTEPTVVVGHSYGGAVMTEAATGSPRAAALVFLAALAPDEGEAAGALIGRFPTPAGFGAIESLDGGRHVRLDPARFHEAFAADVDPERARVMAVVQGPGAAACLDEACGPSAWRSVPSWYLVTEQDRIINPDLQRWMAQRAGASLTSIEASHAVAVSRPREVAALIGEAAAAVA